MRFRPSKRFLYSELRTLKILEHFRNYEKHWVKSWQLKRTTLQKYWPSLLQGLNRNLAQEYKCSYKNWNNIARCWTSPRRGRANTLPKTSMQEPRFYTIAACLPFLETLFLKNTNYFFQLCQWEKAFACEDWTCMNIEGNDCTVMCPSLHLGSLYCY